MNEGLNRRTLAKGCAWAAPVVLAATTIPAYAASLCDQALIGSSTYSDRRIGSSAQGVRIPITSSGGLEVNSYTINIASDGAFTQPANQPQVRNGTFTFAGWNGERGAVRNGRFDERKARRADSYTLDGLGQVGSEINSALVLTQLRYPADKPSSQTVTYTFDSPVYSFSMPIYDLTHTKGQPTQNSYQAYRDVLNFSVAVTMSGNNAIKLNNISGTEFYLTGDILPSQFPGAKDNVLVATYTSSNPITHFSVTYTDNLTDFVGWQGVAFGPISTACPPAAATLPRA